MASEPRLVRPKGLVAKSAKPKRKTKLTLLVFSKPLHAFKSKGPSAGTGGQGGRRPPWKENPLQHYPHHWDLLVGRAVKPKVDKSAAVVVPLVAGDCVVIVVFPLPFERV